MREENKEKGEQEKRRTRKKEGRERGEQGKRSKCIGTSEDRTTSACASALQHVRRFFGHDGNLSFGDTVVVVGR